MKKKDFKAFQSQFLAKEDLSGPRVMTIESVEEAEIQGDGGKDLKPVMHFRDFDKSMVVNNVNWDTIADAYGDDTDDWHGKRIEVYVDPSIMFGNKRVGGVRVRLPSGAPTGQGNNSTWTFDQALAECAKFGITKPELIERMKVLGKTSYSAQRDTATVRAIIEEKAAQDSFNDIPSGVNETVPVETPFE